jgi:hypothetical protein
MPQNVQAMMRGTIASMEPGMCLPGCCGTSLCEIGFTNTGATTHTDKFNENRFSQWVLSWPTVPGQRWRGGSVYFQLGGVWHVLSGVPQDQLILTCGYVDHFISTSV